MIVNSDDPILPDCLARMVGALRVQPGGSRRISKLADYRPRLESRVHFEVDDFNFARMLASISVSIGPGACFRRSVLDLVGYRNPLLRYSADLDYWFRIALAGEIIHVRETLATHRTHPGSAIVAARGDLMAREVAHLFQAYGRHPRAPRRIAAAADAHGHFAAALRVTDPAQRHAGIASFPSAPIRSRFLHVSSGMAGLMRRSAFLEQLGGEARRTRRRTLKRSPRRLAEARRIALSPGRRCGIQSPCFRRRRRSVCRA